MLLEWAKSKQGEKEARELLSNFRKQGQKGIGVNNFIELKCSHISYILNGHRYSGFFTSEQEDNLFKILDYNEGRILTIN
jgi:hypothetical protein